MVFLGIQVAGILLVVFLTQGHSASNDQCSNLVASTDCFDSRQTVTVKLNDTSAFAMETYNRQSGRLHPIRIRQNYKDGRVVSCCSTTVIDKSDASFSLDFDNCNATKSGDAYVMSMIAEDVIATPVLSCPFTVTCDYTPQTTTTEGPTTSTAKAGSTTEHSTTPSTPSTSEHSTSEQPTTTTTTEKPTTTEQTTTPTTTPKPCHETLPKQQCDSLKAKGYCDTNPDYMRLHCGVTCGFCTGTTATPGTTGPTTPTTRGPEPAECSLKMCATEPGLYNCANCYITCKDVKCGDAVSIGTAGCQGLKNQGFPCSSIVQYCPETCGLCQTLPCGH